MERASAGECVEVSVIKEREEGGSPYTMNTNF